MSTDSNDGSPTDAIGIRAINTDPERKGRDFTLEGVEFKHHLKCALCWRGGLFEKGHAHTSCPFLSAQNKLRKGNGVRPVTLDKGWIIRVDKPEEESVEDALKRLKKEVADLTARVVELESAAKRKANAKDDNPRPSKKIKTEVTEEKGKGKNKGTKKKGPPGQESESSKKKGKGRA